VAFGFLVLAIITAKSYRNAPPIPSKVIGPSGEVVFTGKTIRAGQQVFLRYGLMENGTIWGHGGYLGPDFSATYLHRLVEDARESEARRRYQRSYAALPDDACAVVGDEVRYLVRTNRYDPPSHTLAFTEAEVSSFRSQIAFWRDHFARPSASAGLPAGLLRPGELRDLVAFFSWAAWASVAQRPGSSASYTNNFPYDPDAGNLPTASSVLWSALSLIALLGGTAGVLFAFGKFDYLGWKRGRKLDPPRLLPGAANQLQQASLKFFALASVLFLGQVVVGGAVAHYRADPASFYGVEATRLLPSNLLRTWHLQLAIFWIATCYVGGGLMVASALGGGRPTAWAVRGANVLFAAFGIVVFGSLLGEALGINRQIGRLWYYLGNQGWEYLDLGRAWQFLMVAGFLLWAALLIRELRPAFRDPQRRVLTTLFACSAFAIPFFYLPALLFTGDTNFTVVDTWRFWIIHLWVEGFFELFATVMVALIFYQLGVVSKVTAARVIYLDAILFLGAGIIGTGHHWYWTGQTDFNLAFSSVFSAMEVVPLILLTLDAWDFIKLTGTHEAAGAAAAHKWTCYFLMAVGLWNFIGAGVFGFLINLPVVSYFEVGTLLTPNHGHAALMGVFGMLAVALMVFALRQVSADAQWRRLERYVRVSFWGLNVGLALMLATNLFPRGVLQLWDVLQHGYWHARGPEFLSLKLMRLLEWLRLPGDVIMILLGALPLALACGLAYLGRLRRQDGTEPAQYDVG
jgi:nitric oxide reductase subunit B